MQALQPSTFASEVWSELGKLCYHTLTGEYTFPRQYFFVAPQGVGNALSKLLRDPAKLKQGLLDEWEDKCQTHITCSDSGEGSSTCL